MAFFSFRGLFVVSLLGLVVCSPLVYADAPVVSNYNPVPIEDHSGNAGQVSGSDQPVSSTESVSNSDRQLANQNHFEALSQMNQLRGQIQGLRGEVEVLTHALAILKRQQRSQYQDLNQRLAILGGHSLTIRKAKAKVSSFSKVLLHSKSKQGLTHVAPSFAGTTSAAQFLKEQARYEGAYNKIEARDYTGAVTGMQGYLMHYPKDQYASNAHYWLGELFLLQNNTQGAISEFSIVVKNYPHSEKVGDSMLKMGLIFDDRGNPRKARKLLRHVLTQFPHTAAARLASARLQLIEQIAQTIHQTSGG